MPTAKGAAGACAPRHPRRPQSGNDFWFCSGLGSAFEGDSHSPGGSGSEIQLPGEAEDAGPQTTLGVALASGGGSGPNLQLDLSDHVAVPLPLGLLFEGSLQRGRG